VLRFYWPTFRRTFSILWTATDRYVTAAGIGSSVLTFLSPELAQLPWINLPALSRWWAVVPLAILLIYGFLKAIQERFEDTEEKLAAVERHKAVKDLLGEATDKGRALQRGVYREGDEIITVNKQDIESWVHHTHDLIEAAYDKGEARHFMNSDDYKPERTSPFTNVYHDPYKYFVKVRLRRLDELIVRANELPVNPDFDPQEW
jgi:hypothetical protein